MSKRVAISPVVRCAILLAGSFLLTGSSLMAETPASPAQAGNAQSKTVPVCEPASLDSPYIPVDNWVYPAIMRLYSLGYVDRVFLGMRPWTRASISRMLEDTAADLEDAPAGPVTDEANDLYKALNDELNPDTQGPCGVYRGKSRVESVYTVARGISGTPLRDSYHLGQTIVNDYGRPYANGFDNYTGASGYASAGRFLLYARGEFQAAPSAAGYTPALAQALSATDEIPYLNPVTGTPYNQATIPLGPISSINNGRWIEAYVSTHVIGQEISFGKQDNWLGTAVGGAMAYSNNADNIYSFRVNRTEPLRVPGLSYITGPFRYQFMVGSLQGHTYPNDPWVHVEKVSFKPSPNLEFGFERTVIWGGKGHEAINLHTFLRSFFSLSAPDAAVKNSNRDPGARFGAFDFSYRLPMMRNWLTLYSDSEVHDDISPIDAPRRAAWRPGIYLSHVPALPKLDLRAEAVSTDPPITNSNGGLFMYFETVQRQGYTNKGMLFGDWIGREAKGGQGWITYHLSGNEWIQASVRNQKVAKDFIPGGTTLNNIDFQAVKRVGRDFEVNGKFTYEHWKAPIYPTGVPIYPATRQTVTATTIQLTWFPQRKISF